MFSSTEEAFTLLRKWNNEKPSMRFVIGLPWGSGMLSGSVAEVTSTTVQLRGAGFELVVSLVNARFEYDDSRETPAALREMEYLARLTVTFPSGDKLSIFEFPDGAPHN
jgi:hypothetical protein